MDKPTKLKQSESKNVGYQNPPEHSRFKKGTSGNPQGRPKGRLNMATVLERELREKVVVEENGKRITITKLEAAARQLTNKAAAGELKALQLLAALVRPAGEMNINLVSANIDEATGRRLAETYLGRHGASLETGNPE